MPSSGALLYTPPSATTPIFRKPYSSISKNFHFYPPTTTKFHHNPIKIKCCSSSSSSKSSTYSSSISSLITDFDLYDLLGIDSSSDQSQIKIAYRSLQKRCHPDIAGPTGHDMAIILNDAYSILSDPNSRSAYDKEHAKTAEFRGYTGKPLYSTWFGSENEDRAVFVDEIKCVGCLKCALFAEKTFAIESVYGRARVVGQWADPEHKIQDAIQSCPVDCISVVERSNLAALEFLMSKQPRGSVRMSTGASVGPRVSNIFVDIKKFQNRFHEAKDKQDSKDMDLQREVKLSAVQAIRAISNWLYWQSPKSTETTSPGFRRTLALIAGKSTQGPNTNKLREAAAVRRKATENIGIPTTTRQVSSKNIFHDDYWTPSRNHILPVKAQSSESQSDLNTPLPTEKSKAIDEEEAAAPTPNRETIEEYRRSRNPLQWWFPVVTASVASVYVRVQILGVAGGSGRVNEHAGGSLAMDIVNSSWSQVILAGVTWYLIGMYTVELVNVIRIRGNKQRNKEM